MTRPTFSVVAMVRESTDVLDRFTRHYLALGAERVRIFYDGEADEAYAPDRPGVELTVCDRAFWEARLGRQPNDFDEGLRAVFREAHESTTTDWLFFCDADEYLVADRPVPALLATLPADCPSLRILNAEAVWGPSDTMGASFGCTWFRLVLSPRKEALSRRLLPTRRWTLFRQGLVGHRAGKHFLRRGAAVDTYNSHRAIWGGQNLGVWGGDIGLDHERIFLPHFDAISEARWTEKWRRRLSNERPSAELGPHRRVQAEAISNAITENRMSALFAQLYGMSRYEALVLRSIRGVMRRELF